MARTREGSWPWWAWLLLCIFGIGPIVAMFVQIVLAYSAPRGPVASDWS